ncbi:DMT family transporter [Spirilliplanes yamanashiensis]|uniref:Membrane protein n=1 Tax=Spirilliplanes yamanashiensis TaxID=42233 RepID=A0A8J4DH63_9ACTN|nr:DMT family transporter [Spirilliplanes yamanashiensis]MDP9819547.1 DME family drug/metabolite transporter [Spirilliplanes yamanashiensis]GIJ01631.1 membrane protein [Spirilliplanes yamanashiensis]
MYRGLVYVFIAATAWGTGGAAAALLYRDNGLGPVAVSFWRFVLGAAALAGALAAARLTAGRRPARLARPAGRRWTLVVTGAGLAVYQTAYFAAVEQAGLAVATVVTLGAGPALIAAGGRLLLDERLGRGGAAAVALALAGLALLGADGGGGGPRPLLGIALALLSAAGYAAVTLLTRGAPAGDPARTALSGFAVGAVCLLGPAVAEGLWPAGDLRAAAGWLAYLGVVPTALAYGLFFAGLARIRATTASVVALVEPVTAALIGVLALGERLGAVALLGMAVLLAAVAALAVAERRTATSTPVRSRVTVGG